MKIPCIGEKLIHVICTDKGKSLSEGNNFLKKTVSAIAFCGGVAAGGGH
jgi:fructokinase